MTKFYRLDLHALPDTPGADARKLLLDGLLDTLQYDQDQQEQLRDQFADGNDVAVLTDIEVTALGVLMSVTVRLAHESTRVRDSKATQMIDAAGILLRHLGKIQQDAYASEQEARVGRHVNRRVTAFFRDGATELDAFTMQHCRGWQQPDFCLDRDGALVLHDASRRTFLRLSDDGQQVFLEKAEHVVSLIDPEGAEDWVLQETFETPAAAWLAACEMIGCPLDMAEALEAQAVKAAP